MITIDLPRLPVAAKVTWKLRQPTQVNRGEFTGTRRATILAQAPRWSADVEYPTIIGERRFLPWRSALARCQGRANAFRLVACERRQVAVGCTVLVDGAGQQGTTLTTRGWQPGAFLLDGHFITVGDCLLQVIANTDAAGSDGRLMISVMPALPDALLDGAAVEVHRPFGLMAMVDDSTGWTVSPGQQYAVAFSCEEAR